MVCCLQFAQIAEGLGKAKVILACVSKQYANSENCRMEIQFAIKVNAKTRSFVACVVSVSVEFLHLFSLLDHADIGTFPPPFFLSRPNSLVFKQQKKEQNPNETLATQAISFLK